MRRQHRAAAWLAAACLLVAAHGPVAAMSDLAERYVKLVLAVGVHDADYVDAYYGPPEWRAAAAEQRRSIADLDADAAGVARGARGAAFRRAAPTSSSSCGTAT